MSLLVACLLVGLGIVLLTAGGELLVKGAVTVAQLARVRPAVIGLTIVAFGTSVPEMAVSLFAAVGGNTDVALGNVVGSNILNVALIVGLSALITTLPVHGSAIRLEWPFMFGASVLAVVMGAVGHLNRYEGGVLIALLIGFNWYIVKKAQPEFLGPSREDFVQGVAHIARKAVQRKLVVNVALLILGIAILVAGGRMLVSGAVELARFADLSERIIGLTVVAIGTSLPELATSLVAARRGHADLAVANVIGSNIFNILGVLGIVALVHPVEVSRIVEMDMIWMLGFSLLLLPMMKNRCITRGEGVLLLLCWLAYLWWLFRRPLGL